MIEFVIERGSLYAVGPSVENCAKKVPQGVNIPESYKRSREQRDGSSHHITLLHRTEIQRLGLSRQDIILKVRDEWNKAHRKEWVFLGTARYKQIYFNMLCWPAIDAILAHFGKTAALHHITLGFEDHDDHTFIRTINYIIPQRELGNMLHEALSRVEGFEARIEICSAILVHNPSNPRAYVKRATARAKMKDFKGCIEDAKRGISIESGLPKAWACLAKAQLTLGMNKEAFQTCREALAFLRKESHEGANKHEKILQSLEKTMELCRISPCALVKFPRTKHLFDAGSATRDDLILGEGSREYKLFMGAEKDHSVVITVEEKLDGANIGLWVDKDYRIHVKNRGHMVSSALGGQWRLLDEWVNSNAAKLHQVLKPEKHILYGEWLYATHSVKYTSLPSYFIAFDLFDVDRQRFLTVEQRDQILHPAGLHTPPKLSIERLLPKNGSISEEKLLAFMEETFSRFNSGINVEGIVCRADKLHGYQICRAKLVRPAFQQQISGHWSQSPLLRNGLDLTGEAKMHEPAYPKCPEKYPRTPHLAYSPGQSSDDIVLNQGESAGFREDSIVVTEKLDGGNCLLYGGKVFARTHKKEAEHWSFNRTKELYRQLWENFPEKMAHLELYGENMGAVHRIRYNALSHSFYLFAARDRVSSTWLSFEDTQAIADELGIPTVPLVFSGRLPVGRPNALRELLEAESKRRSRASTEEETLPEGFVVRSSGAFTDAEFGRCVAKYVLPSFLNLGEDQSGTILDSATWGRTAKAANFDVKAAAEAKRAPVQVATRVFVDLDGVLVDFDKGIQELTGKLPSQLAVTEMWRAIDRSKKPFFQNLEWMPLAQELWRALQHLEPKILSGIPMEGGEKCARQKRSWCARHLGCDVKVQLCASRDKHEYCLSSTDVLIDDRLRNGKKWAEKGGIFIHHQNVPDTLQSLYNLGIIDESFLIQTQHPTTAIKPVQTGRQDRKSCGNFKFKLLILVGLPGAGKSTFTELLNKKRWKVVSQDEVGSRSACENMIGNLSKRHGIVLDRCNPTAKERKYWRSLSFCEDNEVAVVYFAADVNTCIKRVQQRTNHPTVRPSNAELVVKSFAKTMEAPSPNEGFAKIFRVDTRTDVEILANTL